MKNESIDRRGGFTYVIRVQLEVGPLNEPRSFNDSLS